jgi:hypothetical protein
MTAKLITQNHQRLRIFLMASIIRERPGQEELNMHVPVRFPSDAEVIIEEVARFRALSPKDRVLAIQGLLAAGALVMRRSAKAAFLRDYTLEQENRACQAVKEFLRRHAG